MRNARISSEPISTAVAILGKLPQVLFEEGNSQLQGLLRRLVNTLQKAGATFDSSWPQVCNLGTNKIDPTVCSRIGCMQVLTSPSHYSCTA